MIATHNVRTKKRPDFMKEPLSRVPGANAVQIALDRKVAILYSDQGFTEFYGLAKPVRAPQIGPARKP